MSNLRCKYVTPSFGDSISEWDILTWECQFKREGTLPPDIQSRLFQFVAQRVRTHGSNNLTD